MVHRNNETNLNYVVTNNVAESTPYPIETDASTKSGDPFDKPLSAKPVSGNDTTTVSSTLLSASALHHVTSPAPPASAPCNAVAGSTQHSEDGRVNLKKKVTRSLSDRGQHASNGIRGLQPHNTTSTESVRLKITALTKTKSAGSLPSNSELRTVDQELPPRSHLNSSRSLSKFRRQLKSTAQDTSDETASQGAIADLLGNDKEILLDNDVTNSSESCLDVNITNSSLSVCNVAPTSLMTESDDLLPAQSLSVVSATTKSLCLYCDRTFCSQKLLAKHTERYHQLVTTGRRSSARNVPSAVNSATTSHPGCMFCSPNNSGARNSLLPAEDLSALFLHLVDVHADKYFACRLCQIRFSSDEYLQKHMVDVHKDGFENKIHGKSKKVKNARRKNSFVEEVSVPVTQELQVDVEFDSSLTTDALFSKPDSTNLRPRRPRHSASPQSIAGTKQKQSPVVKQHELLRSEESLLSRLGLAQNRSPRTRKGAKNRRGAPSEEIVPVTVAKASRSKSIRLSGTNTASQTPDSTDYLPTRLLTNKHEQINCTFDDVFYEMVNSNVRQNLSCHLDGKLESGPMSPSPLSPVGPIPTIRSTVVHSPMVGETEIHEATALSALTAFPTLLTADQYGCEPCAPTKKKKPITKNSWKWKWDCVKKYKYINEGGKIIKKIKQPTAGLRDLSKLDMWTQLTMRSKHEDECRKEVECDSGEAAREEKRKINEELNHILDSRMLPQINEEQNDQRIVKLEPLEDKSFEELKCNVITKGEPEFPDTDLFSMLNLSRRTTLASTSTDFVLSGEWARPRCYICFQCGSKFDTLKLLEEHNTFRHPHIHTTHYEIVGRELMEKDLYQHFYIPSKAMHHSGMRKFICGPLIGTRNPIEDTSNSVNMSPLTELKSDVIENDNSVRSSKSISTRSLRTSVPASVVAPEEGSKAKTVCSKCKRICSGRLDLYRHMLDCAGDYAWQQAKKRLNLKYRYFGNRSRRRRAANRINKTHRKPHRPKLEGGTEGQRKDPQTPKVRPSDAESIQRMLANLPKKRASRPIIPNLTQKMRGRKPPNSKQSIIHTKTNSMVRKSTSIPAGRITRGLSLVAATTTASAIGKNISKKRRVLLSNKAHSVSDGLKSNPIDSTFEVRKTRSSLDAAKIVEPVGKPPKKGFIKAIQKKATNIVNKLSKSMRGIKNVKAVTVNSTEIVDKSGEEKSGQKAAHKKLAKSSKFHSAFKLKKKNNQTKKEISNELVESIMVDEVKKVEPAVVTNNPVVEKKCKKIENSVKKIGSVNKTREILKIPKVTMPLTLSAKARADEASKETLQSSTDNDLKNILDHVNLLPSPSQPHSQEKETTETIKRLVTATETKNETTRSLTEKSSPPNDAGPQNVLKEEAHTTESDAINASQLQISMTPVENSSIGYEISAPQLSSMEEPLNLTVASKQTTSQSQQPPTPSSALSPPGKRKVRKLNDCIAMLTGKLQQKLGVPFHESETNLLVNVENTTKTTASVPFVENTLPNNSSSSEEIKNPPAVEENETECNKINEISEEKVLPSINSLPEEKELEQPPLNKTKTMPENKQIQDNIDSVHLQRAGISAKEFSPIDLLTPVPDLNEKCVNNLPTDISKEITEDSTRCIEESSNIKDLELPKPIEICIKSKSKVKKSSTTNKPSITEDIVTTKAPLELETVNVVEETNCISRTTRKRNQEAKTENQKPSETSASSDKSIKRGAKNNKCVDNDEFIDDSTNKMCNPTNSESEIQIDTKPNKVKKSVAKRKNKSEPKIQFAFPESDEELELLPWDPCPKSDSVVLDDSLIESDEIATEHLVETFENDITTQKDEDSISQSTPKKKVNAKKSREKVIDNQKLSVNEQNISNDLTDHECKKSEDSDDLGNVTTTSNSETISTKSKPRKKRKNELVAILADQLLESFKVDKSQINNLKAMHDLAYESDDLIATTIQLTPTPKRKTAIKAVLSEAGEKQSKLSESKDTKINKAKKQSAEKAKSVDDSNIGKRSAELLNESGESKILGANTTLKAKNIKSRRKTISVDSSSTVVQDQSDDLSDSLNESVSQKFNPPSISTPLAESGELQLPSAPIKRNRSLTQVTPTESDRISKVDGKEKYLKKMSNRRARRSLISEANTSDVSDSLNEEVSSMALSKDKDLELQPIIQKKTSKGKLSRKLSVSKVKFNLNSKLDKVSNNGDDATELKRKTRSKTTSTNPPASVEINKELQNGVPEVASSVIDEIILDFDSIADNPSDEQGSKNEDTTTLKRETFRLPDLKSLNKECSSISVQKNSDPVENDAIPVDQPKKSISANELTSKKSKQTKGSQGDEKKLSQRRSSRRKNTSFMEQENGDNLMSSLSLESNSSSSLINNDVKSQGTDRINTIFNSLLPQNCSSKEKGIFGFPLASLPSLTPPVESVTTQKKPLLRPSILSANFNRSSVDEISKVSVFSPNVFKLFASEITDASVNDKKLSKKQNEKSDKITSSPAAKTTKESVISNTQKSLKGDKNSDFDILKGSPIRKQSPRPLAPLIGSPNGSSSPKKSLFETTQDTILSAIVKKIQNPDQTESDDDLCITEIAKSLNDKIMTSDEFSNGVDTPPAEYVLEPPSLDSFSPMNVEAESSDSPKVSSKPGKNAENDPSAEVFDADDNTNTEVIDMDLEDDMSVYTSFSADTTATKLSGKKKRKTRKTIMSKTLRRNKRLEIVDGEIKNYICDLCNKTYRTSDSLAKHKMTLTHISKLSELEFIQSSQKDSIVSPDKTPAPEDEVDASSDVEAELPVEKSEIKDIKPIDNSTLSKISTIKATSSIHTVNSVLQSDQLSESSLVPIEEPQPPVSKSGFEYSPVPSAVEKNVSKNSASSYPLNPSGIEPISSPEMETSFDRYNHTTVRSTAIVNTDNSRMTLSQEERLFYECCSMLKGSDRPIPAQPMTAFTKYDSSLSRLSCEEIVTKPVTPKSTDHYSFVGPETAGSTAQMIKSPRSKHSPRQGIPKIDVNQFSDISSDSNPMYFRPEVPKCSSATQRVFLIDAVSSTSNKLSELLSTAEKYAMSGNIPSPAVFFNKTDHTRPTSFTERSMIVRRYPDAYSDMGDSFPSSQDASESENYARTIATRNNDISLRSTIESPENKNNNLTVLPISKDESSDIKPLTVSSPMDSPASSISSQSSSSSALRTKGALKGYENLKVSIPTSGLDLQHALDRNHPSGCKLTALADIALRTDVLQTSELVHSKPKECKLKDEAQQSVSPSVHVSNRKESIGNHLGFKERKKIVGPRLRAKSPNLLVDCLKRNTSSKDDIYEFDESQDNTNVTFASKTIHKVQELLNPKLSPIVPQSNEDSQLSGFSDRDDFNFGLLSDSSSSSDSSESSASSVLTKRSNKSSGHNLQKKSLIMGRIFKKKQQQDAQSNGMEEIKRPAVPPKQDLDKLFDSLRSEKDEIADDETSKKQLDQKIVEEKVSKKRQKNITKKDSTEVEEKPVSNRSRSRKPREMANIEAELGMSMNQIKEMIGVGQRKPQRRCAATKSKTFAETWSSDEYEDFHSTSDIIALIQEAEAKAMKSNRARNRNSRANVTEKKPLASEATKNEKTVITSTMKIDKCEAICETKKPPKIVAEPIKTSQKVVVPKKPADTENEKDKENKQLPPTKSKQVHFELDDDMDEDDSLDESVTQNDNKDPKSAKQSQLNSAKSRRKKSLNTNVSQSEKEENESDSDFESDWNRSAKKVRKRRTIACRDLKDRHETLTEKAVPIASGSDAKKSSTTAVDSADSDKDDKPHKPTVAGRPMPRRKRIASEMLYYWSSSSDEEFGRIKPREAFEDDNLEQHGWIVGDSHKKLVTLLAHAKGKKIDDCGVKETGKKKL